MWFCSLLAVYRVPVFLFIFYTKIQERKIKFWVLYQKIGCPGLQGVKRISMNISILQEDRHRCVSVLYWWFIEYLSSLHFLYKD